MRLTYPTTLVLQALLQGHHHGFDIMDATGLPSGTVYPILRRLDAEGYVRSRWEKDGVARREQRPPRRYYELTPSGRQLAHRGRRRATAPSRTSAAAPKSREVSAMSSAPPPLARARHHPIAAACWCPPGSATTGGANGTPSSPRSPTFPIRYRRPIRRALGAFADAFWLRQRSIADFDWIDDVRHGVRQLAQHGGFAVTAIGILALGLAATVTMFSVTDQILLRPLPYPDPDRIVTVWETRAPTRAARGRAGQPARLARARAVVRLPGRRRSVVDRRRRRIRARRCGFRPR